MIQRTNPTPGEEHSKQTGQAGEEEAFGNELSGQPQSAGTDCQADAELAPASDGSRGQQRANVCARNQQQHCHCRLQAPQS
jgi:hypothetical protein